MKHFDKDKWMKYKRDELEFEEKVEIEEHLYSCDRCMEVFLSTIGEGEIKETESYIPADFTENIMKNISKIKPMNKVKKKKAKAINDFFLYYAAVASVAIILTAGGLFGEMVDIVPKIDLNMDKAESQIKAETIYNISASITDKTSDFINNFGIKKMKED